MHVTKFLTALISESYDIWNFFETKCEEKRKCHLSNLFNVCQSCTVDDKKANSHAWISVCLQERMTAYVAFFLMLKVLILFILITKMLRHKNCCTLLNEALTCQETQVVCFNLPVSLGKPPLIPFSTSTSPLFYLGDKKLFPFNLMQIICFLY